MVIEPTLCLALILYEDSRPLPLEGATPVKHRSIMAKEHRASHVRASSFPQRY